MVQMLAMAALVQTYAPGPDFPSPQKNLLGEKVTVGVRKQDNNTNYMPIKLYTQAIDS